MTPPIPDSPGITRKELTALVWLHAPTRFTGSQILVLLKLAGLHKAIPEGFFAFPGTSDIATSCALTRRGAQKIIAKLKKSGILKVRKRAGHSNLFAIDVTKLRALPKVRPDEPSAEAYALSRGLRNAILKDIQSAIVPEDWDDTWPASIQSMLSAGHSVDLIKRVARFAIDNEPYKTTLATTGAVGLTREFEAASAAMESHQ